MTAENETPKPVRFDFPPGTAADAIAAALRAAYDRVMAEKKAKGGDQPPQEGSQPTK